jgi:hypothetical protein
MVAFEERVRHGGGCGREEVKRARGEERKRKGLMREKMLRVDACVGWKGERHGQG